jgi:asparagine synthase (glutamine-hydrolysing)
MCGIAGRFNLRSDAPADPAIIGGMCDLLAHRGPDADGVWADGPVCLGHRRLAIIDLSPAGRQPMHAADGELVVSFNGEIYNFLDLRRDLESRGHRLRTRTDTEVILAAYREWGVECLQRLRGMFAFAIWDGTRRALFVARDRVGKKPLFYHEDGDGLAFASEPKAFLADPSFRPEPDLESLAAYLTYQYVPSPRSAFAGVRKLPPAHYLLVEDGRVRVERYWKLSYGSKRRITEAEAIDELLDRLREAVRLRLISDVPLGAFLSGGVDSGTVVALMAGLSNSPVKTFSIGFEEEAFNELPYARLVAERYGTDHHEFIVRPDAVEILPQLVWHYGEPFADPSAIPTYYLSELARRHVTVALNGDAGDENFAGYTRYVDGSAERWFDGLPGGLQRISRALAGGLDASPVGSSLLTRVARRLGRVVADPGARYAQRMMVFGPGKQALVFSDALLEVVDAGRVNALLTDAYTQSDARDAVDAKLDVDVQYYLPDCLLVKVDIATMAHALEGRSPMLDQEFMEFAASLPTDLKLRGGPTKYLLKQAARRLLPAEIIDRPKKGFGVPLEAWFRHDLKELTGDLLLDGRLAQRAYFKPGAVDGLVREHQDGSGRWHNELWTLVMMEAWHRMFIDQRPHHTLQRGCADVTTLVPRCS